MCDLKAITLSLATNDNQFQIKFLLTKGTKHFTSKQLYIKANDFRFVVAQTFFINFTDKSIQNVYSNHEKKSKTRVPEYCKNNSSDGKRSKKRAELTKF